jgi:putative transposase
VSASNQFTKAGVVKLPVRSTKALNGALSAGWVRTNFCEIKEVKGRLYVLVFVQKKVDRAVPMTKALGVDVGYRNSIATSEGQMGKRLDRVIKKRKKSNAERSRQRMKYNQKQRLYKNKRSEIKQLLDKEAKYLIGRSKKTSSSLAVESSKVIANLRSGSLQGWARCYLSARVKVLGKEESVFVLDINPAYSSMTCSKCEHVDGKSRDRQNFKCVGCGHVDHADINAAKVLGQRGRRVILDKITPRLQSGRRN